jgi:hypothetical protein
VSWLPDGSGFVCQRERRCKTWAEARALIPAEEVEAVERLAPVVRPLLEAAASLGEHANSIDRIFSARPLNEQRQVIAAVLRAYQDDPATLEKLLLAIPDGKETVENFKSDKSGFDVGELCLIKLDAKNQSEPKTWHRSLLNPALMPKVSPKHDVVACLTLDEDQDTARLEVMPMNGGPGLVVAQNVSGAFDWLPDGRTLVFMAPLGDKDEKLQGIHRIAVVQESGALMKLQPDERDAAAELSNPVTLATIIMLNRPVLQSLPDGRVLFASQPASLPLAGAVPELGPRLYLISADGKSTEPIPTTPGDLPTDLGYFVASPDGKYVAVVESETDAVAVVEIKTGKTQIISPPHPNWHCETLPAWKSAAELTFAALHGPADGPKWMLWSEAAGVRCISERWPAEATADWLEHKKPASDEKVAPLMPNLPSHEQ